MKKKIITIKFNNKNKAITPYAKTTPEALGMLIVSNERLECSLELTATSSAGRNCSIFLQNIQTAYHGERATLVRLPE